MTDVNKHRAKNMATVILMSILSVGVLYGMAQASQWAKGSAVVRGE